MSKFGRIRNMRKTPFVNGEIYHVYNRGTDKRIIFSDNEDIERFIQSMEEFNVVEPIGSIYENSFILKSNHSVLKSHSKKGKLVNFIAYCLNPNHYHFLLEQVVDRGIEKFMQRIGNGYTKYFNNKNERSGSLFQGKFKSIHIDSNEYLLHVSVYVNLNDRVHELGHSMSKFKIIKSRSSWGEYIRDSNTSDGFCKKDIILEQFKNINDYRSFAESSLEFTLSHRGKDDVTTSFLLE